MSHEFMNDVYKNRRDNLMAFLEVYDTQAALAEACDIDTPYLNAVINKRRNIGDKVARKIELNLELLLGSLDREQDHL